MPASIKTRALLANYFLSPAGAGAGGVAGRSGDTERGSGDLLQQERAISSCSCEQVAADAETATGTKSATNDNTFNI